MFANVEVNRRLIHMLVDTRATHNYLASPEVERLGLILEEGIGQVKVVNSAAEPIVGLIHVVEIDLGLVKRKTTLIMVRMDNFQLILGMEFLRDFNITIIP